MDENTQDQQQQDTRNAERFVVKENILVYNEKTFADIIDISKVGLSCRYLVNLQDGDQSITTIDLLNSPERLHIRDINCQQIHHRDLLISPTFPSTVLRTCGIKFKDLDKSTFNQLANFIEHSRENQTI